jgi:hypothetical protein
MGTSLIGIFNDKFRGGADVKETLGPELTINGNFEAGDFDWNCSSDWSIVNDGVFGWILRALNVAIGFRAYQNIFIIGRKYKIIYNVVEITAGTVRVLCGINGYGSARSVVGVFEENLVCVNSAGLGFEAVTAPLSCKIDNVSAKEILNTEEDE